MGGPKIFNWLIRCPARRPRRTLVPLPPPAGGRESEADIRARFAGPHPWTLQSEWTSVLESPAEYPPDLFRCLWGESPCAGPGGAPPAAFPSRRRSEALSRAV